MLSKRVEKTVGAKVLDPSQREAKIMPPEVIDMILDGLEDLAAVNRHDFAEYPALVQEYERNMQSGRHEYKPDWVATECKELNCWSPYLGIARRYKKDKRIPVDCKDCSTSHAAYLAVTGNKAVYLGLIPGLKVSHAVAGIEVAPGKIQVIDPSRWYGMTPTTYEGVHWRRMRGT